MIKQDESYNKFISASKIALSKIKDLEKTSLYCDHICYRVETFQRYEELKNDFLKISDLISEIEVRGRPICIFKLHEPLMFNEFVVPCIELPAPKNKQSYREGWEHAEFVIPSLTELINSNPEIPFDITGIDRKINAEIGWQFSDDYQIKFHEQSIEEVIQIESELKLKSIY